MEIADPAAAQAAMLDSIVSKLATLTALFHQELARTTMLGVDNTIAYAYATDPDGRFYVLLANPERPLELVVDVVMHCRTKYLAGH